MGVGKPKIMTEKQRFVCSMLTTNFLILLQLLILAFFSFVTFQPIPNQSQRSTLIHRKKKEKANATRNIQKTMLIIEPRSNGLIVVKKMPKSALLSSARETNRASENQADWRQTPQIKSQR